MVKLFVIINFNNKDLIQIKITLIFLIINQVIHGNHISPEY